MRDIKAYSSIFRYYRGVRSHNQIYSELSITLTYTSMPYSELWVI